MPKIKINDISMYYETYGSGDPVVFIGGFTVDHLAWANIVEEFAKKFTVILPDNRGSGQSDAPDAPYTVDMMAQDIVDLCGKLNIKQCHFVGNSMGSAITQTLAYKHPELCKSITLSNGFTKIDTRYAMFAQGRLDLFKVNISPVADARLILPWIFSSNYLNQEGVFDFIVKLRSSNLYPMTEVGYRSQLQALLNFDSSAWVGDIRVPTLVITADADIVAPEAEMKKMASQIKNSAYYCFHDVGHVPWIEKPVIFCDLVREFLEKHG